MKTEDARFALAEMQNDLDALGIIGIKDLPLCELAPVLQKALNTLRERVPKGVVFSKNWIVRQGLATAHGWITRFREDFCP